MQIHEAETGCTHSHNWWYTLAVVVDADLDTARLGGGVGIRLYQELEEKEGCE